MNKTQSLDHTLLGSGRVVLRLVRVHQWTKNAAVLAAVVASGLFLDGAAMAKALIATLAFCLLSAAVYIMNDIADVESDRTHPRKRNRPIASGAVSVPQAVYFGLICLTSSLFMAVSLGLPFLAAAVAYLVLQVAYSFHLKHVPIVDFLAVGAGFALRAVGGALAIGVMPSTWLIAGTFFLALFLIISKRRSEAASAGVSHRRVLENYTLPFLDHMTTLSAGIAICTYLLYASEMVMHQGRWLFSLTVPCVIYVIARYFMVMHSDDAGEAEDPARLLFQDQGMRAAGALFGLFFILASWR